MSSHIVIKSMLHEFNPTGFAGDNVIKAAHQFWATQIHIQAIKMHNRIEGRSSC